MPEIIIQADGDLMIPRGHSIENQFFISLLKELVDQDSQDSLSGFFEVSEQSEVIFGIPGLCG